MTNNTILKTFQIGLTIVRMDLEARPCVTVLQHKFKTCCMTG